MILRLLMAAALAEASPSDPAAVPTVVVNAHTLPDVAVRSSRKCLGAKSASAPAPKVVSVFPRDGQVVRPGLVVVRIAFDRPMTCNGFFAPLTNFKDPCAPHKQEFLLTFDRKTVRTLCFADPGQTYGITVGGDCSRPFVSLDDQRAEPLAIHFKTSDGPRVTSDQEAVAEEDPGPAPIIPFHGVDGTWQGEVEDSRGRRPLILHLSTDANGVLSGAMDSPFMLAPNLEADRPRLEGDKLTFDLPINSDAFSGVLSGDGSQIRGVWRNGGKATTFTFKGCPAA